MTDPDYIDRVIKTIRNHRDAANCWPQWCNILADEVERLRAEVAVLAKNNELTTKGLESQCERMDELKQHARRLEAAIRKHRDQRGDDRCWLDDEELYRSLPEGYTPPARDSSVELALCEKYIACRHNPATEYVSPERRIEELEAEVGRLREIGGLADRVAAQSELLTRRADKEAAQ